MRVVYLLLWMVLLAGCSKDSPKAPEAARLLFPEQNSECTTGVDLNGASSRVTFRWQKAAHTDSYELRVTNILTNITQTVGTDQLSAPLPLQKGAPFTWLVITRNTETQESAVSTPWQFYNAGTERSHAPFPAQIIAPKSGATVFMDINNEVELEWSGADVENDIVGYEVFFSTENPPQTLFTSTDAGTTTSKVGVAANTVYFWKIITIDGEGNRSDSGVFGFKAL